MYAPYYYNNCYPSYTNDGGQPHNAVLDVVLPEAGTTQGVAGSGLKDIIYTATGGETEITDAQLQGAGIAGVTRDGLEYTRVQAFSAFAKKEYFNDAGTIIFHPGLPPLQPGEDVIIKFIPMGEALPGTGEPVTVEEARAYCKIESSDDDSILSQIISAARGECERFTGIGFVYREEIIALLRNDLGGVPIPYAPVVEVKGISDGYGNQYDAGSYTVIGLQKLRLDYPRGIVNIVYSGGYTALPQYLKSSLLNQILWMYQNRGDAEKDNYSTLSPQVRAALGKYRMIV